MFVDHVCTAESFALAIQSEGAIYQECLAMARRRAGLAEWQRYVETKGMRVYRRLVRRPFAVLGCDAVKIAVLMREHYTRAVAEGA